MDALHLIEEHLWMRASDEVTLKFHTSEKQIFPQKNFLSQSYEFLTTAHIGEHNIVFTLKNFVFTCLHVHLQKTEVAFKS